MKGGIKMDKDSKNTWNHSILSEDDNTSEKDLAAAYEGTDKYDPNIKLSDPAIANVPLDLDDGYKTTLLSMFPTSVLAQVDNTYAIRHLRPKGPGKVELVAVSVTPSEGIWSVARRAVAWSPGMTRW